MYTVIRIMLDTSGSACKSRNRTMVYEGETSRSARMRGIEHVQAYKRKAPDSVMYKHKILEHQNEDMDFVMEITGVFKDALTRQAEDPHDPRKKGG